ncbi:metallophosphoesterase family protein [Microvirga sp. GCM10011540]|uniref:metallophosphoesterase family protein n=1 Tax=Microvirga sp. GCM10011540 TaxID=3317338 RepID=UPI00360E6BFD
MLTYAIGDIHGRHDLLQRLLGKIREHAEGRPHRLVFLGDYIDRGPDSAAVIATVRALQGGSPDRVICLMGNHEDMLLKAIGDPTGTFWWVRNGGDAALASFGVRSPAAIPGDLLEWIGSLPTSFEDEKHYYVHAGLRPGRPFERQSDEDRLWIREPFLEVNYDFGKHVVHGHTPLVTDRPDIRRYRTNLDTGAVFRGVLTAGVFTAEQGPPIGHLSASSQL